MGTGGSSAGTTGLNTADEHVKGHGAKGRENAREHMKDRDRDRDDKK
jgi:hypothetical protein